MDGQVGGYSGLAGQPRVTALRVVSARLAPPIAVVATSPSRIQLNRKSAKKVADGLIKEVPKQMEKDGLLSKNPAAT